MPPIASSQQNMGSLVLIVVDINFGQTKVENTYWLIISSVAAIYMYFMYRHMHIHTLIENLAYAMMSSIACDLNDIVPISPAHMYPALLCNYHARGCSVYVMSCDVIINF